MTADFVEALVEAPMGVALLARIEEKAWPRSRRRDADSDAEAIELAVDWVGRASVGEFLALAVWAVNDVYPWNPTAHETLASSYRCAETRLPIAAAIAQRFDGVLHAPMDAEGQEWWTTDYSPRIVGRPMMIGGKLWTVSRPPPEVHDEILLAWEFHPPPTSRWQVEIEGRPKVKEIHRPEDWVDLVERWPDADASRYYEQYGTWSFETPRPPRPRPRRRFPWRKPRNAPEISEPLVIPGHAVRPDPARLASVDWDAAAEHYDAVHLSWAGLLTAEGYVSDLADGSVTMLRGFASERTLWLTDVFAPVPASPLDAPEGLTEEGACGDDLGINVAQDDSRAAWDMINLGVLLGRREAPTPQPPD